MVSSRDSNRMQVATARAPLVTSDNHEWVAFEGKHEIHMAGSLID